MRFETFSGSTYELEGGLLNGRVRRISGSCSPTERQGPDGEFKRFMWMTEPMCDYSVVICWDVVQDPFDGMPIYKTTTTSYVTKVEE